MADKVLILHDNRADRAALAASSVAGTLVAANLQDRLLGKVWRATGFEESVTATWSLAESVNVVALLNHNLSTAATIRVRVGDGYDETFYAWPALYGLGEAPLGTDGLGGLPYGIEDAAQGYKRNAILRLGETAQGTTLRLDIADPDNADGYVQAGRLIAGLGWQPTRNFSFGWSIGWEDPSEQTEMDGGALWVEEREPYRVLTLPFRHATRGDALGNLTDLARIAGNRGDVLVVPFPDSDALSYFSAIYGIALPGGVAPQQQDKLNVFTSSIKIRELTA